MAGKISIRIDKDGNTHIEVNGIEGSSCETMTEALLRDLGEVDEQQYTEEYSQDLPDFVESFEAD